MTTKARYAGVIEWFQSHMPVAESELHYGNPYELLVSVILSAQCTDKRVNITTPALFAAFPTPQAMAQATPEEIYPYIKSISYPNNKARNLAGMARMLCEEFGGEVPSDLDQLRRLPGVGRKTANVVQAVWFGRPTLAVDTHVYRVSHRLGLVPESADTPRKVEDYLMAHIPEEDVADAHHWLLLHGRYVCQSARPKCGECPFDGFCPKRMKGSKLR